MNTSFSSWQRPKTTRRYVHPPKAERMYTIWAEGKIILSQIEKGIDFRSYPHLECNGIWPVHGEDDQPFDFRFCENRIPENGTPIHGLIHRLDQLCVELEVFCSVERKPTCFLRIRITNNGTESLQHPFALLMRSGKEKQLVYGSPDVYKSYMPDVNVWKNAPVTWRRLGNQPTMTLTDEDVFLLANTEYPMIWDGNAGALRFDVSLAAGESAELVFAFGKGGILPFDYAQEKKRTIDFWDRELTRLNKLPISITSNPEVFRAVQNLTVQLLQCFCYRVGENNLLARQGGLQRLIWPWESIFSLEALSRIGDFSDYIEPVLAYYFDVLQAPNGEIRPAGEGWANITASALYSFAKYCLTCSTRFYYRYRDHAMAAFDWIKRTRASSVTANGCFSGLFPPMRACDNELQFQAWMTTDIVNLDCLNAFADLAEHFNDPRAGEIRKEYQDYYQVMHRLFEQFEQEAEGSDQLRIPLCPNGNDKPLLDDFYFYFNHGRFTAAGIVKDEDTQRVLNYLINHGIYRNGLYGHMPYRDGNTHIWYTSNPEYYWFFTWLRLGDRKRAEEILEAQFRYSMTDEYYMIERFADNDPYFTPWSPNASANGRTIIMMLNLYQD